MYGGQLQVQEEVTLNGIHSPFVPHFILVIMDIHDGNTPWLGQQFFAPWGNSAKPIHQSTRLACLLGAGGNQRSWSKPEKPAKLYTDNLPKFKIEPQSLIYEAATLLTLPPFQHDLP